MVIEDSKQYTCMMKKLLAALNKLRLRNQENPNHICKVFITPDLTPLEHKKNKELRFQLAEKNKTANLHKIDAELATYMEEEIIDDQ